MRLPNIQNWFDHLTRFRIILLLTLLGLLAYANAVNHPFVHDDVVFIQKNPHLGDLNLKNLFLQTSSRDSTFPLINQYYRPLLEFINRILYRIVNLNPHGFHFFNILLHIVNSFLVYNIIFFITDKKKGLSLALAVFFLLHPVQSEAVACISGISNLVFAFFCMLSFYTYLISVHTNEKKKNLIGYVFSLLLFLFALLAKEQSVILPVLILAYELCSMSPLSAARSKKLRFCAGFFFVLAGYFLLRKMLFGSSLTPILVEKHEFWMTLLAIPRSLLVYLGIIFYPHDLHYYRSQDILLPYMGPIILLSIVVAAAAFLISKMPHPQKRWMIFGVGWFIISMLPTLNIIPMVNEYSLLLTAEHFLYFPVIGILLFIFSIGHYWITLKGPKESFSVSFLSCVIIVALFMGMTIKQNTYWRAEIPLFERTVQYQKNFARARFHLGKAYADAGRFPEAVTEDRKALAIMEGYLQKVKNEKVRKFYINFIHQIHYHLGYCLDFLEDRQGSLEHFKKALSYEQGSEIYQFAVGSTYIKAGNIPSAIPHLERVVQINENNLMAANSLAICYQEVGDLKNAEKYLRIIADKDSQSVSAKQNLERFLQKNNIP